MDRLTPQPKKRRTVSRRVQSLISYAWIIASLALPTAGAILVIQTADTVDVEDDQTTYVVRSGDTLSHIALRYGVTVDDLVAANGLSNPSQIYVGQVLVIPRLDEATGSQVHTVQVGETLALIARRYGLTTDELMTANGLTDVNSIYAGQELIIPGDAVEQVTSSDLSYTMVRGDSLYRIALIFGVTVDDLLAANSLPTPNSVYPGLVLRIPAPTAESEAADKREGGQIHVVQPGETLAKIAITHEVTVDGLIAANNLTALETIYPGQMLNIPEAGAAARPLPAQAAVTHTVGTGETLSEIALRYGVTVHSLSVSNSIDNPARVAVGTVLSIPAAQITASSVLYGSAGEGVCTDVSLERTGTGYFARPVRSYVVTQLFRTGHSGIDLAADLGTPIYAADGGTVVYSGWNTTGYGNLVILDHGNGWRTYYAHLNVIYVGCGEWVPRGSVLGEMGSTGNSTGPHLHFEMLRFGTAVNPEGYIRF